MTAHLTINAFKLARSQARIDGRLELASLPRVAPVLAATHGALDYDVEGWIDADGHPGATLKLRAVLPLVCQRCGEVLDWNLERQARFRFVRDERALDQVALDDDELDAVVGSVDMDAVAWMEDEVLLSMPLVPSHADCHLARRPEPETAPYAPAQPFARLARARRGQRER